jgi:tripartite-type tricarboxylate transporter receptor subunit TctC
MPRSIRLALFGILVAGAAGSISPGLGQGLLTRPVRLVVGFTAGGPTDVPARLIAEKLSVSLAKPVIVENKPGAASMLAINDVLSQPRNGQSLWVCTYFDPLNTLLYRSVRYKISDIAPITLIAKYDYMVAVSPDNQAKDLGELVEYVRQHQHELNYGHLGVGSTQNLLAKKLEKIAGMKMNAIPYKGAADALREVAAGRLDLFMGPPLAVMPLYSNQRVKVLAVTGTERLASAPDIPTVKESGIPLVGFAWLGVCAGAGTPQPIIDDLHGKIVPIINSSEYRSLVERSGSIAVSSTPREMQAVIDETVADAAPIVEEFKLHME